MFLTDTIFKMIIKLQGYISNYLANKYIYKQTVCNKLFLIKINTICQITFHLINKLFFREIKNIYI